MAVDPETMAIMLTWLWSKYGKDLISQSTSKGVNAIKKRAEWNKALENYLNILFERVARSRVLGKKESQSLEGVFTDINILDRLTAEKRYDIEHLIEFSTPRHFAKKDQQRKDGLTVVKESDKLFILGKPGAGKTTFLKHITLQTLKGNIDKKVPVFLSLKELSDSERITRGKQVFEYITTQFETYQLQDADAFVGSLLSSGDCIVLCDGLDEVNLEDDKRSHLINALNEFIFEYGASQIIITCRVAATDYSFEQFKYVEIADFSRDQIESFIDKWFIQNKVKRDACIKDLLETPDNEALLELAQVPLLLTLLCLVFEERHEFPPNRDEIYEEAIRALLNRWDAERNIRRDHIYKELSLRHKQTMLSHIASKTFNEGKYFIKESELANLITEYLEGVPKISNPNGELVLKSMEAQHGIFIERAKRIHSFSHLTIQEYFTSRYVVNNEARGEIDKLMEHVADPRWEEVFLLTASMLDNGTQFCEKLLTAIEKFISNDEVLTSLLSWAKEMAESNPISRYRKPAVRAFYLYSVMQRNEDFFDMIPEVKQKIIRPYRNRFETIVSYLDLELAQKMNNGDEEIKQMRAQMKSKRKWNIDEEKYFSWNRYLRANILLLKCLQLIYAPKRSNLEAQLLLPPHHV